MGFSLIVPPAKVKTGSFKIATVARQGGAYKLLMSIPSAIYTQHFGAAERLTIQLGDGADAGTMLLQPDEGGLFKPTFLKHATIIRFPELDWPPQFKMEAADPEFRKANGGGHAAYAA
ncbi:hypothetical protein [Sinorhizobium americanum]|uniref:Uncharacterized protein n=1 Tax=Sinorhizobium americanum TaxID=194963 RepID=A0A4R2BTW9_9HYPH|nr:hypothetical protein [Sinorhizobium americanum]TCN30312.1 hypothetical protein EV184_108186 [Sinorhizobium americanum]